MWVCSGWWREPSGDVHTTLAAWFNQKPLQQMLLFSTALLVHSCAHDRKTNRQWVLEQSRLSVLACLPGIRERSLRLTRVSFQSGIGMYSSCCSTVHSMVTLSGLVQCLALYCPNVCLSLSHLLTFECKELIKAIPQMRTPGFPRALDSGSD